MIVYGITGGIASGKSTVTKYLQALGYIVLDADLLAKEALGDQVILKQIQNLFPSAFSEDVLNRKALGQIIFNDVNSKALLENIIHPYVINKLKKAKQENKDKPFIFFDVPLLFESELEYLVDYIILISIDEKIQLSRLLKRDKITRDYALKIKNNQLSNEYKIKHSHYIIENNKDISNLYQQVDLLLERIKV